jgi:hypothetical protein
MPKLYVNLKNIPSELKSGINRVSNILPLTFTGKGNTEICFTKRGDGVTIYFRDGKVNVDYAEINDAFRALGLINARLDNLKDINIREKRKLEKTYVMLDVSRNAVLNSVAVDEWLKFLALAGVNGFMFYTEDTYEVPGEEYFGYMRGRYSIRELKGYDQTAADFGIEMIPCIQTLAHLQRILQYPCYAKIKDTDSVMLCGEKETYEFIEKMITAAVAPYRSKRIHIGMDEAWDLGRGNYLSKNGYVQPFEMMVAHLDKVMSILRKHKLKPMMWSDMFFRALSKTHNYYDTSIEMDKKITSKIPKDVDLVFWDYYHTSEAEYAAMIDKHIEMGGVPIFAPGLQSWSRFWAAYERAEITIEPGLKCSFDKGVKETIITIWGDDGTECDYYSTFPLIQFASDMIFTGKSDMKYTKINLQGSAGIDYDAWRIAGQIDMATFIGKGQPNMSKSLLWEDPLYDLCQAQLDGKKVNGHFKKIASELKRELNKKGNERLTLPFMLADILSEKGDLPTILKAAYKKGDKKKLKEISGTTVPALIRKIKKMNAHHRELWLKNYKPFGWEVLEKRYGGLVSSFENLKYRLDSYLSGKTDRLEELEIKRLKIHDLGASDFPHFGSSRVYSTGQIFHSLI